MGRNLKITAEQVLEILIEKGQVTLSQLAEDLGVCPATVRDRLRELRKDGEPIIHSGNGVMRVTKEELENDASMRESMRSFLNWTLRVMVGVLECAKPSRPLLPTLRRTMKESLDTTERQQLATACTRIKGLLDYIEIEEEDEVPQIRQIAANG